MVSLFAFMVTAYGMNPYLVGTFNSSLACETARSALLSAALEQNVAGTSSFSMAPRTLKCIGTPGIIPGSGGGRPPEASPAPAPRKAPAQKK